MLVLKAISVTLYFDNKHLTLDIAMDVTNVLGAMDLREWSAGFEKPPSAACDDK